MPRINFISRRLFVDAPLRPGLVVGLTREQANYLLNVLRLREGAELLIFNGRDGEWSVRVAKTEKKSATLVVDEQTRPQEAVVNLHLVFAPLKHARLDYLVQKSVEMGIRQLVPVITRRTQVTRVNLERIRANIIEAAEQCGVLSLPEATEEIALPKLLDHWPGERLMIFCDEFAEVRDPIAALAGCRQQGGDPPPMGLIVGPEGGFDEVERIDILKLPNVIRLSLGPRILRADTAAVAALALVQSVLGDWRE